MTEETQPAQEPVAEPVEKAPEVAAAEVASAQPAAPDPVSDEDKARLAAANEDDTTAPVVEAVHHRVHNPNALRGVRAGPLPHPRQR